MVKLAFADHFRRLASLAKALQGASGMLDDDGADGLGHADLAVPVLARRPASRAGPTRCSDRSSANGSSGLPREDRPADATDRAGPNREPVAADR